MSTTAPRSARRNLERRRAFMYAPAMANVTHLNQPVENMVALISDAPGRGEFYPIFGDGSSLDVMRPFRVPDGAWLVVTDVLLKAYQVPAPGVSLPFRLRLKNLDGFEHSGEAFYPVVASLEGAQTKHIGFTGGFVVGSRVQLVPETSNAGTIRVFGYLLGAPQDWADAFRSEVPHSEPEPVFSPIDAALKGVKKVKKKTP